METAENGIENGVEHENGIKNGDSVENGDSEGVKNEPIMIEDDQIQDGGIIEDEQPVVEKKPEVEPYISDTDMVQVVFIIFIFGYSIFDLKLKIL